MKLYPHPLFVLPASLQYATPRVSVCKFSVAVLQSRPTQLIAYPTGAAPLLPRNGQMDDGRWTTAKQLAGAFYGMSGIPSDWRDKLALKGLIESMAEELFDMSNRIDPCPPPPPPSIASEPSAASMKPSRGETAPGRGAQLSDPSEESVTRFTVKPAVESDGDRGRPESAYWVGGVAAHYQRLEDAYV